MASATFLAACAATPWGAPGYDVSAGNPSAIYLETNQFLWVDVQQREQLACRNGTLVVCTGGSSRLSLVNCGCFPAD